MTRKPVPEHLKVRKPPEWMDRRKWDLLDWIIFLVPGGVGVAVMLLVSVLLVVMEPFPEVMPEIYSLVVALIGVPVLLVSAFVSMRLIRRRHR